MPRVIPGPPATRKSSRSLALALRHGQLYLAYITSTSVYIFRNCRELIQIIEFPFDDRAIQCIAFDARTGHIALSSGQDFVIYDELYTFTPQGEFTVNETKQAYEETSINWTYGRRSSVSGSSIKALSWGLGGEILVGNDRLSLYHHSTQTQALRNTWNYPLAAEVEVAIFSPDASLIVSYGRFDKLVKVWRRLSDRVTSSGTKTSDFDFIYLPHARTVDDVKWRQPLHENLMVDNIVYTTSIDQELRAWASDIPHDSHLLTLHETLSLECEYDLSRKVAVVLDDDVFSWALAKATKRGPTGSHQAEAQALLQRVSKGQFEVVLTLSIDSTMQAYTLHNLGSRNHKISTQELFFESSGITLLQDHGGSTDDVWISAEVQRHGEYDLLIIVGCPESVTVYETQLFDLFSTKPIVNRLLHLDGHEDSIESLLSVATNHFTSRDASGKTITWQRIDDSYRRMDVSISNDKVNNTNGHLSMTDDIPPSIQSAVTNDVVNHACSKSWIAIVTADDRKLVQIWGGDLSTKFSNAPVSTYFSSESIVGLCWHDQEHGDSHEDPHLAVYGESSLSVLCCRVVLAESDEMWTPHWRYDFTKLTLQPITRAVFHAEELVVAVDKQLYTFMDEWYKKPSSMPFSKSLPVYHPVFLRHLIAMGKLGGARTILAILYDVLVKSSDLASLSDGSAFSNEDIFADASPGKSSNEKKSSGRYNALFDLSSSEYDDDSTLSSSKAASLLSLLKELNTPGLREQDLYELTFLVNALVRIAPDESSLDVMGRRFYLSYIIMQDKNRSLNVSEHIELSDEDVLWATNSEKQDILLNLVKSSVKSLTWTAAKAAKVFCWLKDRTTLLEVAETVAKAEFLKGESRDPVAASIWYQALRKKTTLLSLWRTSGTHPEHNLTTKILANDFGQAKWITTANKNAYALVGRRRFEYAAAWFLLAGSLKDAVHVCVRNVNDLDLALAIARIWEEDHRGEVVSALLANNYQVLARSTGSRVMACWAAQFVGNLEEAMQLLTTPFGITTRDPPALLLIYKDLRARTEPIAQEEDFVTYGTTLLDARGCQRLSAYILRTWTYEKPQENGTTRQHEETSVAEFKAKKREVLVEAPQAVYQEPTMDSFAAFDF